MIFDEEEVDQRISVLRHLSKIHRKVIQFLLKELKGEDLSRTEVSILFLLKKEELKTSDLSKEIGVPSSTLTGIIDRLEERGYVCRYRSKEDRRVVMIGLAHQVQKKMNRMSESIQKVFTVIEREFPLEWWIQINQELEKLDEAFDELNK